MMQKRLRKLYGLKKELVVPHNHARRGETLLIGWGSTQGAIKEAVDGMRKKGYKVNRLHLSELWPFPAEAVTLAMAEAKQTYVVENNATGQLARLIRRETGKQVDGNILKYDGRPFTPALITAQVLKEGC
jgi:2-oxoglutarate ferredoxin oxidoreductase subunit alpha